jgi:hypothetical protein
MSCTLKYLDNAVSGQHEQREERHYRVKMADGCVGVDDVAVQECRFRDVAPGLVKHQRRDVDARNLASAVDQLPSGRRTRAAAQV